MTEHIIEHILPPFPFPSMWKDVHNWQQSLGQRFWLVPSHFPTAPINERFGSANSNDNVTGEASIDENKAIEVNINIVDSIIENSCVENDSDQGIEFYEELQLNDVWAERFSKTLKKLKVKAMKSRNRMKWSKNRK